MKPSASVVVCLWCAAVLPAANLDRLTWAPGTSGREWDYPANWSGTTGEYPDELHEEAYFYSPALQPLLDRSIAQLGRLTFATAGWIIEQEGTNQYTITFYNTSNDYNAIYSAGSGTNTVLPGAVFNVNGQNVYSAANNVLILRRLPGVNACIFSSTTATQDNTGVIVLDGNNAGVQHPFLVRQGTLYVAHPQALGASTGTVYLGDSWSVTNARARLLAGTNGIVISKPIEVRDVANLAATLGSAAGVTTAAFTGALTLRRSATVSVPAGTLVCDGRISGNGGVMKTGAGRLVVRHPGNNYTGGTFLAAGILHIATNHALGTGPVVITNGTLELAVGVTISNLVTAYTGTVTGAGTIAAPLIAGTGGVIAPGLPLGRLSVASAILDSASVFAVQITGATSGSYDTLAVSSTSSIHSATLQPSLTYDPQYGEVFTLIDMLGTQTINGAFAGYPEGGTVGITGRFYQIKTYLFSVIYFGGPDGNDMVLTCVPEPGAATVLALLVLLSEGRNRIYRTNGTYFFGRGGMLALTVRARKKSNAS